MDVFVEKIILLITIFLPFAAGALLPLLHFGTRRAARTVYICAAGVLTLAGVVYLTCSSAENYVNLWQITPQIALCFRVDGLSKIFALVASGLWVLVSLFSHTYMKHEKDEDRFFTFFLLSLGALIGMDFAANLVCMYVLYELLTLAALPLVLHSLKKEAVAAALKYLFYSVAGAFMVLFGILFFSRFSTTLDFAVGGVLTAEAASHQTLIYWVAFVVVLGFGAKAGLFPLHGWLPTAHPVAPAPASAVLSAVITKAGVLGIIRVIYYIIGPEMLRGSWVQIAWLALALLTVFMGSMMAYREKELKKRLAYSSISQISYVLTGVFLLSAQGIVGALLHVVFHAVIKTALFLCAGAIIYHTGHTRVDEFKGIGKQMPVSLWSFALVSLGLVGIPPASGFVSKWYLATASLDAAPGIVTWLAPAVLLISALLTAGYLIPIVIEGFFPGKDYKYPAVKLEDSRCVLLPLVVLAALTLIFGMFPTGLLTALQNLAASLV